MQNNTNWCGSVLRNYYRFSSFITTMFRIFKLVYSGFFTGEWGFPQAAKNLPIPPTDRYPRFLTRACPPNWVLSPKISIILPHFSLNFDYFLAQNCIRKLYLNTTICSNFAVGGHSLASADNFPGPPHLTSSPMWVPPIWLRPQQGLKIVPESKSPPHQKFCEKTLVLVIICIHTQSSKLIRVFTCTQSSNLSVY